MKYRVLFFLMAVLFLLPVVILAVYAAAPGWAWPDIVPERLDGRGYRYLADRFSLITHHLLWSLCYSLATTFFTFLLCLLPARVFARRDFRFKSLLEGLLLAPALVPAMTFSMGIHFLFIKINLADTLFGVIIVLTAFSYPYMLRALTAGFQAYGEEYELCAKNLGAGPLQRFFQVDLPLLVPAILAGGSVVFLVAFSEYFLVFLIGGGTVPSYTGFLFPFLGSSDRAVASILTLFFLAAPITLFFLIDSALTISYRKKGLY